MRRRFVFLLLLVSCPLLTNSGCAQTAEEQAVNAAQSLQSGAYDEARAAYRKLLGSSDTTGVIAKGYLDTFLHKGDYEEGVSEALGLIQSSPNDAAAHFSLARLYVQLGRFDKADTAFRNAGRLRRNYWANALELADLLKYRGEYREANELFGTLRSAYKQGYFKTADELTIAGRASAQIKEFRDANKAFRESNDVEPGNPDNLYWWAEIFRLKYNDADAQRTYQEAIGVNPNRADLYVGLGLSVGGFAKKEELARKALAANTSSVDGRGLLASLHILDGEYAEAKRLTTEALAINPKSIFALSHQAAAEWLLGDTVAFRQSETAALAINPSSAEFYVNLAEDLALRFRYPDAAVFSRRAVEVDRNNATALATFGTSLLRLGRADESRRHFDRSYQLDKYNLFVSNTLTLLDEYQEFDVLESDNFKLVIHSNETDVLGYNILDIAEEAYDSLSARYPYRPAGKLLIEAFNDKDDFAVRIAGIPHLGLLGVSFGDVVAINTPKAQAGNDYNWARTLWHEIAHTMAIGASKNRVPRWFTEGLSVYEEKRARPAWGREMDLEFYSAYDRDKLHRLAEIDRGFTRPEFPGQVLLSYYHASKVIGFIADNYGFKAVADILTELAGDQTIAEAIETVTGSSQDDLDAAFLSDLKSRRESFDRVLAGMPDLLNDDPNASPITDPEVRSDNKFLDALKKGRRLLASGNLDDAETEFRLALSLYPDFVGSGNAYLGLAEVYRTRGETDALSAILKDFLMRADYGVAESRELAALYSAGGSINDLPAAATYLRRSVQVDPYDSAVRAQLADIYARLGSKARSVQERKAVVALDPVDKAQALYELALAYYENEQVARSKRTVLQSLEIAPGFRDAQKLLLRSVGQQ